MRILVLKKEKDIPITKASILVAIDRRSNSLIFNISKWLLVSSFNIKIPIVIKRIVEIYGL